MAGFARINTNVQALNALNNLNNVNNKLAMHQMRMTTGKQINSPSDDPAGWTIATKLSTRADGLGQALTNINSSKDMIAVSEGHMQNIQSILEEMRVKAEEAANDTLGTDERNAILNELQDFNDQIDLEVDQAQWNGQSLLAMSAATAASFSLQIGADTGEENKLTFAIAANVDGITPGSGGFKSAGLNVDAGAVTAAVSDSTLSTDYTNALVTAASGTASGVSSTLGQLEGGHYTLEVSTASAGAETVDITMTLRDSEGDIVQIDADGDGSGVTADQLSLTTSAAGGSIGGTISLGNNLAVDLGSDISTTGTEGAVFSIDYTEYGDSVSSQSKAQTFMDNIDTAVDNISESLSYTGALTNRLTYQETSLTTAQTRTEAARSTIEDADMAYEQLESTKLQILQQTATAMLSQANMAPQNILGLFGGGG